MKRWSGSLLFHNCISGDILVRHTGRKKYSSIRKASRYIIFFPHGRVAKLLNYVSVLIVFTGKAFAKFSEEIIAPAWFAGL